MNPNEIDERDCWPLQYRRMVEYLETHSKTSDRTIAKRFGCHELIISRIRQWLGSSHDD
jgi:hypothetical protein